MTMVKEKKSELQRIEGGLRTNAGRQYVASLKHVLKALREDLGRGMDKNVLTMRRADALRACQADYHASFAEERAEIEKQLEAEKIRYQKAFDADLEEHNLLLSRARVTYAGMDDDELINHTPGNVDEYLAHRAEIRQRGIGPDRHDGKAAAEQFKEPWKAEETARKLISKLDYYKPAHGGLVIDTGDGVQEGILFSELIEAVDGEINSDE